MTVTEKHLFLVMIVITVVTMVTLNHYTGVITNDYYHVTSFERNKPTQYKSEMFSITLLFSLKLSLLYTIYGATIVTFCHFFFILKQLLGMTSIFVFYFVMKGGSY